MSLVISTQLYSKPNVQVDKPSALSPEDFQAALGLQQAQISAPTNGPNGQPKYAYYHRYGPKNGQAGGPVAVFSCSLLHKMGYKEAFEFMSDMLKLQGGKR